MALYNDITSDISHNKTVKTFKELVEESINSTSSNEYKIELNKWYEGNIKEVQLTKTNGKCYPCIKIVIEIKVGVSEIDNKDIYRKMNISHILSNSCGAKSIKEIKKLLSILGFSNDDINKINNIETEFKFLEYLQQIVGTPIKIKSISNSNTKSYIIERKELSNE